MFFNDILGSKKVVENSIELNVIKNGETATYKTKDEIINYFTQILNTQ